MRSLATIEDAATYISPLKRADALPLWLAALGRFVEGLISRDVLAGRIRGALGRDFSGRTTSHGGPFPVVAGVHEVLRPYVVAQAPQSATSRIDDSRRIWTRIRPSQPKGSRISFAHSRTGGYYPSLINRWPCASFHQCSLASGQITDASARRRVSPVFCGGGRIARCGRAGFPQYPARPACASRSSPKQSYGRMRSLRMIVRKKIATVPVSGFGRANDVPRRRGCRRKGSVSRPRKHNGDEKRTTSG